jgi:hypothetical protein
VVRKYYAAKSRTSVEILNDVGGRTGEVTCRVTYRAPLFSPGMRRFFQTESNPDGDYLVVSDATLPSEAALTADGSLGIDYQSK